MSPLPRPGSGTVKSRPASGVVSRFGRVLALAISCTAGVASSATAQAVPGVLLVTEFTAGNVAAVQEGGDFAGTARFATGLSFPIGLCIGPNDDIFVVEYNPSRVRIITEGGDFSTGDAFATGIPTASALACSSTTVYVMSFSSGEVFDISDGGDFMSETPLATITGTNQFTSLRLDGETLWAGANLGVWDISAGGTFDRADRYATDDSTVSGLGIVDSDLYVGRAGANIVAVTMGAALNTEPAFATVPGTLSGFTASDGYAFAKSYDSGLSSDSVFNVTAGGDFTAATPLATGLGYNPFGGMLYYTACGNGVLQAPLGEECDDAGDNSDTMPDACRTNCHPASCGDGVVDTGEGCDEGEANDDSGACHTDCQCADDADSDGTCDADDACDDDADKTEPGVCGCGAADTDTDTDSDDTLDCTDMCPDDADKTEPGACGCGMADTDTDSDHTPDCDDTCPDDADKTEPGACGCSVADTDADSDGTPDCDESSEEVPSEMCVLAPIVVDTTTLAAGDADCPQGGVRIAAGYDDGEPDGTAGDDVLQSGEIDSMRSICNPEGTVDDLLVTENSSSCSVHVVGQGEGGFGASMMVLAAAWLHRRRRNRARH